jgi:hypothetical protein
MGNSSSSARSQHEETVDFGFLTPQVYTGPRDWNQGVVAQTICERRLAPFYRPLEDYDEGWDEEQIIAARKEPPDADGAAAAAEAHPAPSARAHGKRASHAGKEPSRHPEAAIYRGAVECPICFLVSHRRDAGVVGPRGLTRDVCVCAGAVLPAEHQLLALLRAADMHRVLRADQARGADAAASGVGAGRVSVLRPGGLWRGVHAAQVAHWDRE